MTSAPLYNLTWGEFGTSLVSAVQLLRCHEDFVDVTLVAGGRTFPAHKIVLCAASPFLMDLLKTIPCKHPIVMLAGVNANDLETLLEFIYRGEVSVNQAQLPSLLQAANCLNIQGLASNGSCTETQEAVEDRLQDVNNQTSLSSDETKDKSCVRRKKRPKKSVDIGNGKRIKSEHAESNESLNDKTVDSGSWSQQDISFEESPPAEPDVLLTSQLEDTKPIQLPPSPMIYIPKMKPSASDQPGACPLCGAVLRQARNLRRHLLLSCKCKLGGDISNLTDVKDLQGESTDSLPPLIPVSDPSVNDCSLDSSSDLKGIKLE